MPTAKPRLQVTLSVPQHELLKRLAKLQKRSSASIIAELFESMFPVLERVAVVLQAAVRAQESAKEGLMRSTADAERELRPHLAAALGQLDLLSVDFERSASPPGVAERSGGGDPRPVTRGSGFDGKAHTKHASQVRRRPKLGRQAAKRPIRARKRGKHG